MHDNELVKDKIEPQHMHSGDKCESTRWFVSPFKTDYSVKIRAD